MWSNLCEADAWYGLSKGILTRVPHQFGTCIHFCLFVLVIFRREKVVSLCISLFNREENLSHDPAGCLLGLSVRTGLHVHLLSIYQPRLYIASI